MISTYATPASASARSTGDARRHGTSAATANGAADDAELLDGVPQHGEERHVGELRRALRGGRARRVARGEQPVRAERVGQQPAHADRDEAQRRRDAVALPPQPQPVEAEERPHLRPQQPGGDAERERRAAAPGEVREHAPQHRGGEPALGVAERAVEQPPRAERHHERGDRPRRAGPRAAPRARTRPRARAARPSARAPPTRARRRGPAAPAASCRARSAASTSARPRVCRLPVEGVVAPRDPDLRVERQRPRQQQRQRGQRRARRDERRGSRRGPPGDEPHVRVRPRQRRLALARRAAAWRPARSGARPATGS